MRVLLYAPVDLNLIDGSAIWCASVTEMLCRDPDVQVDVLLHTPLNRDINVTALVREQRISLLDSWKPGECRPLRACRGKLGPRLKPEQAFERIQQLDAAQPYHLLILRGGPICRLVARMPCLAGRSWFYLTQHGADCETVEAIAHSNGRIACQTLLLQEYFEGILGAAPGRYVPLPPMIPRLLVAGPRRRRRGRKLCYIGKFDPDYRVEEMIAAFGELRASFPDAEFIVAGDKFHDPEFSGEYQKRLTAALTSTPGLSWQGGLSRGAVGELLAGCDLGSCWRSSQYDSSLELSTKVLEYAAAGLPVLLNPSRVNRLAFGDDYPLYVDSIESFRDRVTSAFSEDHLYRQAAETAFETSKRFTFDAVNSLLQPYLAAYRPASVTTIEIDRLRRIVFAGHDFKFCSEIIEHFEARPDCLVRRDKWLGHAQHHERGSEELLRWADSIWCEWCLGNAVWYSARVRPDQRLVIRLHRQEITTPHPDQVRWQNVHHLILIAPHVQRTVVERIGPDELRDARLIHNLVDTGCFTREKTPDSPFRLGLLGYCPKLKNPRLAAEILLRLLAHDERWMLVLTGRSPESYPWLWARPEERRYYEQFEEFIAANRLDPHLVRHDWTDDPHLWYASIGFILSCSDLEGSHQAIPEGMAAGCVPVVRRWPGAAELYPNSLLFETADEAARLILENASPDRRAARMKSARREARERFDRRVILPQLEGVLFGAGATSETTPLVEPVLG